MHQLPQGPEGGPLLSTPLFGQTFACIRSAPAMPGRFFHVPLPSVSIGDRYKLRHAIEVRQPKQEEIASARKGVGEDARQAHGRPRSQCRLILTSHTRNHLAWHARDARNLRRIQSALGEDPYTSVSLRPRTRPNYKWVPASQGSTGNLQNSNPIGVHHTSQITPAVFRRGKLNEPHRATDQLVHQTA